MENRFELYCRTIEKWGEGSQIDMIVEECAELIQAINKHKRKPNENNLIMLAGEIADVEIMLEQAKLIYKISYEVETIKKNKLVRLEERLNKIEEYTL